METLNNWFVPRILVAGLVETLEENNLVALVDKVVALVDKVVALVEAFGMIYWVEVF